MTETKKAVFVSYASEDAEVTARICETLRAAGIEVWFDQNELRGGDAWDAAIRKQIKSCALFIPVFSVNTHARVEGYFRQHAETSREINPLTDVRGLAWAASPGASVERPAAQQAILLMQLAGEFELRAFPIHKEYKAVNRIAPAE